MTLFDAPPPPPTPDERAFRAVVTDHRTITVQLTVGPGEDPEAAAVEIAKLYFEEGEHDARSTSVALLEPALPFGDDVLPTLRALKS